MKKDLILFVGYFVSPKEVVGEIKSFFGENDVRVGLIYDKKSLKNQIINTKINSCVKYCDIELAVDMSSIEEIKNALFQEQSRIIAVTTRGESFLKEFKSVIQILPESVLTPTVNAIDNCSDKSKMREALRAYDESLTPKSIEIKSTDKKHLEQISQKTGFPLIIKPSGLSTSMLVTKCSNFKELQNMAKTTFDKIQESYETHKGRGQIKVLAEEFMSGPLYSVDAYIDSKGEGLFCPAVRTITGAEAGKSDFYGYLQSIPAGLSEKDKQKMNNYAQKAINAVGLKNSSAHIELILSYKGWKIVEIGPRTGGQRTTMYRLSHNIKHSLNDILTRTNIYQPKLEKFSKYVAYLKFYAEEEGIVEDVNGINEIIKLKSYAKHAMVTGINNQFKFARHGGLGVMNLVLANRNKNILEEDIKNTEKTIKIIIK